MSDETDKYLARCHRQYIEQRSFLDNAAMSLGKHYDTWLLTLAGGALLLSVTFMEKIITKPEPLSLWFLILGWSCLLITIILQMYAIHRSQTALNQTIFLVDYQYKTIENALRSLPLNLEEPESPKKYIDEVRSCNNLALYLFAFGILFLGIFSCYNLGYKQTGENMTKKPLNESRGTYVPSPPAMPPPLPTALINKQKIQQQQQKTPPTPSEPTSSSPTTGGVQGNTGNNSGSK